MDESAKTNVFVYTLHNVWEPYVAKNTKGQIV